MKKKDLNKIKKAESDFFYKPANFITKNEDIITQKFSSTFKKMKGIHYA